MFKVELIGNLGADAELQSANGQDFVSFKVAHSFKSNDKEITIWASCSLNGNGGKLLCYLKKGQKVFVRGNASLRVFSSEKYRCYMAGLNVYVSEIELCGSPQQQIVEVSPQAVGGSTGDSSDNDSVVF